jgi:eukaryotic-like serine/threonine-protein kinase
MKDCPPLAVLDRLLEEQLDPPEQLLIVSHVETCFPCQQWLERLTAGFSSFGEGRWNASLSAGPASNQDADSAGSPDDTAVECATPPPVVLPEASPADLRVAECHTPLPEALATGPYFPPPGEIAERPCEGSGDPEVRQEASPSSPPPSSAPPNVPGYDILKLLGRGGMGIVYKARQRQLNRLVALKMIRTAVADEPEHRERFYAEAQAVALLHHPNILQIYEIGEAEGLPFFALEYLEGGSLHDRLDGTPQPARPATELLVTLARAVQHAHQHGIVHRDLKPGNVLFGADGTLKVADFGLAKRLEETAGGQTQVGQVMGSPHYMAPEQAQGQSRDVGPAADVYALGVILYEMLTGRVPLKGTTVAETLRLVIEADPVPPQRLQPGVPRDLETICLKCLRKEPAARYESAAALAEDLDRFLTHRPILARPTPWWERVRKWVWRRPALAGGIATTVALVVAGTAGSLWYYTDALDRNRRDAVELANGRYEGQKQLFAARDAVARRDWNAALNILSGLIARIEREPRLDDLREEAEELQRTAESGLKADRMAAGERQKYQEFQQLHDDALFHDAGESILVLEENRLATRQMTAAALELFGGQEPTSLAAEQRTLLAEGRYELLLVRAAAVGRPLPGEDSQQQAAEALRLLEEAARLRPTPTRAYFLRRAACLAVSGDKAAADQARAEADRLAPVTASDHFLTGQERYRAGELAKAAEHFRAALGIQEDHFWAQYLLALVHLRSSPAQPDEAVTGLTACVVRRPKDFVWSYLLRGYAHAAAGHFDHANEDYHRAEEILRGRPDDDAAYALLVNRGVLHVRQKEFTAAVDDLQRAIGLKPRQYTAYANLAQAYAGEKRWPEALAQLDEALRLQPDKALLYRARAGIHLAWAGIHLAQKDKDKDFKAAQQDFEEAIKRDVPGSPDRARDQTERGRLLLISEHFAEALAAADEALKIIPDLTRAHALRVEALLGLTPLKRNDELLRSCDGYLARLDPAAPAEDRADLYHVRAMARVRGKDFPGAVKDYHEALTLTPQSSELHTGLGWVYLLRDAPKLAEPAFDKALRLRANNAHAYNGRGLARVKLGQYREGTEDAEQAVHLDPESTRTLYNAVRIYAQAALVVKAAQAARGRDASPHYEDRAWGQLCLAYEERACGLLRQVLDGKPQAQRAEFWQETVRNDEALLALRRSRSREFATLAAKYAAPSP